MIFESTEDYDKLIAAGNKHISEGNKSEKEGKKYSGDEYFLMRRRGMIRNSEYRKFMAGKNTVYEYIWSNIIRDKMYKDIHNVKENYYDKGFLVYCSNYRHIAKKCFMSTDTVIKYIEEFESIGVIKTDKIGFRPTKKDKRGVLIDRRPTVFILGTWHKENEEKIIERYYIDDVFYE